MCIRDRLKGATVTAQTYLEQASARERVLQGEKQAAVDVVAKAIAERAAAEKAKAEAKAAREKAEAKANAERAAIAKAKAEGKMPPFIMPKITLPVMEKQRKLSLNQQIEYGLSHPAEIPASHKKILYSDALALAWELAGTPNLNDLVAAAHPKYSESLRISRAFKEKFEGFPVSKGEVKRYVEFLKANPTVGNKPN